MTTRAWAIAACVLGAAAGLGCGDDSSGGGGGANVAPGLWVGSFEGPDDAGWNICLYVGPDGDVIQAALSCSLDGGQPFSIDLDVENAGTDPNDQRCSFDVRTTSAVPISNDGSFAFQNDDGVTTVRIEGQFATDTASGTARASGLPIIESCSLDGWTAAPANP